MGAQHGQMLPMFEEAEQYGFDIKAIQANPGPGLQAVSEARAASPTASTLAKPRERVGLGQVPGILWEGVEDGISESKISVIGYQALLGRITIEEANKQIAEIRSQMHDQGGVQNYGFALRNAYQGASILGQMMPAFKQGATLGAATGLGLSWTGVGALPGLTVGMGVGVFKQIGEEASGRTFMDLSNQRFTLYEDLDKPGEHLTENEYRTKRGEEKRYTREGGYVPEEAQISPGLAKATALSVGIVVGALEVVQATLFGSLIKKSGLVKKFGEQAVSNMIEKGQVGRFAATKAAQVVGVGAQETGIEVMQEIATYTATQLAGELNPLFNDAGVPIEEQQRFVEGLTERVIMTVKDMAVPMTMLSAIPGTVGGTAQYTAGRMDARSDDARRLRTADGTTERYFEQSTGEDVVISDIAVDAAEIIDRDMVIAKAVIEGSSKAGVRMQPVPVSVMPDGTLSAIDPTAAAVIKVMRDAGVKSVRTVKRDVSRGPADAIPPWEMFSSDPIQTQIAEQFPDDSVAEVQAKMMPLHLAAMKDNVSVPDWVGGHFQDGMLFKQPSPEPEAPAAPTVDAALFDRLRLPDAALPPMAEREAVIEPQAPDAPVAEGEQASLPGVPQQPEAPQITIEPRPAPAPVVEQRRRWRRRAFAMGRVIDELEFGWQAGIWKTPAGWLEDSGLSGVVTVQEIVAHLGTDALSPADSFGYALRETMAQELLPPQEMVPPLSETPEPTIEPALPALPEVTALQLREPGVAEFAPRAPEATREPPIPLETMDDAAEEALAVEQSRRMREAEAGPGAVPPEGPVMSSKTYLASVESDAIEAADEFLAKAAKNVSMDRYEDTAGGLRTPVEHAALLTPAIEQERVRLETEAGQQRIASQRDLMRQAKREQRDAALAREVEGELEPPDAEAPEIEDVPYHKGTFERSELTPAFDSRIPVGTPPVIYIDMESTPVILSGLTVYNAAVSKADKSVAGTILRADEGVSIEEAKEFAIRRGQQEPTALPDDVPSVPITRSVIKSDGEEVGAVEFDMQGRAVFESYDSADFKTWIHSLARVFRQMLPAREEAIAARWSGVTSIRQESGRMEWGWNDDADYRFASGFEQYLREGRVRVAELQPIWIRLSEWTKASYAGNSARLNRQVRNVYESFLVDETSPSLKSYQSSIQMIGQVGQMVFRSPTTPFVLRLASSGGRDLTERDLPPSPENIKVEAIGPNGQIVLMREYKDLESAVRDISGIPSAEHPAPLGDASFRPFRARRGSNGGFFGPGPPDDPSALSPDVDPGRSVYVGGKPVNEAAFVEDAISRLDRSGELRQAGLSKMLTSWRRYDYLTELLASGVDGPVFQLLSRDIDTGRMDEKRLRFDLQSLMRNKLLRRGWSERELSNLPRAMKETVTVAGWKHADAMEPWTVGKLLSFNRHLRAGQNRATLLSRGMRDGPDGTLISLDVDDIQAVVKAWGSLPQKMRDFGTEVVDEIADYAHEKQDAVYRKARGRTLGYVPHYWALERAPQDKGQETIDGEMEDADAIDSWRGQDDPKLGIYEGMTMQRTQRSAPVVLRPLDYQLLRDIDRASMYVGFELPLRAASALFDNPRAVAAMERRMDPSSVQGLRIGLEGVARRWIDEQNIDKIAAKIQRGVTVATLGANVGVWIKQTLSFQLYNTYVPQQYMAASISRATISGEFSQMRDRLKAFDPTFQARSRGFDISLQGSLEGSAAAEAWGRRRVTDLAMKGISYFDQKTVVIGSHAAFLQAIDEFRTGRISEEVKRATGIRTQAEARALGPDGQAMRAYRYANWVTVRTQPNFLPEHVSSFQRHKITRFLSMFSGYTNVAYNLLARTMWRARQTGSKRDVLAATKAFTWIFIGSAGAAMIIDYLNGIVLGTAPEEDELPSWAARKFINSASAPFMLLRDAVYAFGNPYGGDVSIPLTSAATQIIEGLRDFTDDLIDGEIREATMKKLVTGAGISVGLPFGHLYRYTTGIIDLFDPMSQ